MGKYFCRVCKVKGFDTADEEPGLPAEPSPDHPPSPAGSQTGYASHASFGQSDVDSDGSRKGGGGKGKKRKESLNGMAERIKRFLTRGEPRMKADTIQVLQSMRADAQLIGNQTKIKICKTQTGIKDNFLDHFIARMNSSYAKVAGHVKKQDALDTFITSLPAELFSPIWQVAGLNPHSDTPVEILHVILLGFVKYFWRDVTQNQIKKN
ncbi:hypothetical protein C0991_003716, partial [Blastosporella zonata]